MKKILLVGMFVISGLSFGRDFEYREKQEFRAVEEVSMDSEMISREREILVNKIKKNTNSSMKNLII